MNSPNVGIFQVPSPAQPVQTSPVCLGGVVVDSVSDPFGFADDVSVPAVETPLDGALRTAALGIRVAPVTAGKKIPPIKGFPELATTDAAQILAWANEPRWANCNWASVARPNEFCFIDEDDSDLIRKLYQDKYGDFPRTRTTQSQPGHRQSCWKQTDRTRKFGNKVQGDFKDGIMSFRQKNEYCLTERSHLDPVLEKGTGHRDYVLFDDSPVAEMPYQLMEFIESLLAPAEAKITAAALATDSSMMIPEKYRNDTLISIAGTFRRLGQTEDEINTALQRINQERCSPQLSEEEVAGIAHSACRYPQGDPRPDVIIDSTPSPRVHQVSGVAGKAGSYVPLEFKYSAVIGTAFDFVIAPPIGSKEGWFPLGDPSLIGGPSGSNKTTFMFDLLQTQFKKDDFLGHQTFGLPYLVLGADRGENATLRTASRMNFQADSIPQGYLPSVWNDAALHAILEKIEERSPIPKIVFIEGCDMLVDSANKMEVVTPFVDGLQKIAKHYHIAIIGSVGSPKARIGEGYASSRDKIFGTVAWSRKTETIAVLQYIDGDDTDCRRSLAVLLRNGPAEKYDLEMVNGRLAVKAHESSEHKVKTHTIWFQMQGDWFTVADVESGLHVSQSRAYKLVEDAFAKRILKTKKKAPGAARFYKWNDQRFNPDTNRSRELAGAGSDE